VLQQPAKEKCVGAAISLQICGPYCTANPQLGIGRAALPVGGVQWRRLGVLNHVPCANGFPVSRVDFRTRKAPLSPGEDARSSGRVFSKTECGLHAVEAYPDVLSREADRLRSEKGGRVDAFSCRPNTRSRDSCFGARVVVSPRLVCITEVQPKMTIGQVRCSRKPVSSVNGGGLWQAIKQFHLRGRRIFRSV
jgi:hypothetical protein